MFKKLEESLNRELELIHEISVFVLSKSQRMELIRTTLATLHAFLSWIPLVHIFDMLLLEAILKFFPMTSYMNLTLQCLTKRTFQPFIYHSKRFYTVLLWRRVLAFLVVSQLLRIVRFYSTQLPGHNYHCREGSKLATLPRPDNVWEVLLINFPRGVIYGCGDLIFSSHMIFTLVFVHTYHKYGSKRFIKTLAWLMAVIQSLLIIGSHKHYSVDVVVAWYTVNLVVFFVDKQLPEMPDRAGGSVPLLPLSTKEKDRTKEENHKLLNETKDPNEREASRKWEPCPFRNNNKR